MEEGTAVAAAPIKLSQSVGFTDISVWEEGENKLFFEQGFGLALNIFSVATGQCVISTAPPECSLPLFL